MAGNFEERRSGLLFSIIFKVEEAVNFCGKVQGTVGMDQLIK